jgi:membrane protease YdiL (CAAX protease family)
MDSVLFAGLCVFGSVSVAVAICNVRPAWKHATATVAPITLAIAAFAVSAVLLLPGLSAAHQLLLGGQGEGWIAVALALTLGGAVAAFRIEALLVRRTPRRRSMLGALPPELLAADLPSRAETMADVAKTARRPVRYWTLSVITVLAEELFFRVAAPAAILAGGYPLILAIVIPALLYAVNHIGFGIASMAGKFLFGLVLGLGAWLGGALPVSIIVHLTYQALVQRQFTVVKGRKTSGAV